MQRLASILLDLVVLLALALVPSSQGSVWVIDDTPGAGVDFASIQSAIDSATVVDGDVLLVKPGTYGSFNIAAGKALTIQSDSGGTVTVNGPPSSILAVPSGKSAHLRGLILGGLVLKGDVGNVWVEQCTITAPDTFPGVDVFNCSDVVLVRDSVRGGNGLDCAYFGVGVDVGSGLFVSGGSHVHSYGCRLQGGIGGTATVNLRDCPPYRSGGDGVHSASQQDRLFFSDCQILGGSAADCDHDEAGFCICQRGGAGLNALGRASLLDCTVMGGPPDSSWASCGTSIQGPDFLGTPEFLPGRSLRVTTNSPVRENGLLSIHLEGPPHVPVVMAFAGLPHSTRFIDLLRGVVLLPIGPATGSDWVGVTNASGVLDLTLPTSQLPAGAKSSRSFLQFAYLESPTLPGGFRVLENPAVPKTYVLGGGSLWLALDEQF